MFEGNNTPPNISLDDINLPDDQANLPADLPAVPNPPDQDLKDVALDKDPVAPVVPESTPEPPKPEDKPETPPANPDTQAPEQNNTGQPASEAKPTGDEATPPAEEKLSPFHEHPDWKKMQEKNESLEKAKQEMETTIAEMKGKVETLLATTPPAQQQTANTTARERIQEDIKNGWQPKDTLEVVEKFGDYLKEELETKQKIEAEKVIKDKEVQDKAAEELRTGIVKTFEENGVSDPADWQKVTDTVIEWTNKGALQRGPAAVGIVIQHLKATGQLTGTTSNTPPAAPTPSPVSTPPADNKDATNNRIGKPNSGGGNNNAPKAPLVKNGYAKDVDTIVLEASEHLG